MTNSNQRTLTTLRPLISVLIVHFGPAALTTGALRSLQKNAAQSAVPTHQIEVLIWNNSNNLDPVQFPRDLDVRLLGTPHEAPDHGAPLASPAPVDSSSKWSHSPRTLGFGAANNRLAEFARGQFLLLLNNDVVMAPGALAEMLRSMSDGSRSRAVTPQFRSFDGRVLEVGSFLGDDAAGWQLFRDQDLPRGMSGVNLTAHYGSAACLLISRDNFRDLGGFCSSYSPAYYEDTDLCMRLRAAGGLVVTAPRAVVFHLEGGRRQNKTSETALALMRKNRGHFFRRWNQTIKPFGTVSFAAALRHTLADWRAQTAAEDEAEHPRIVLWLLHEFLNPRQSGGHARITKEIVALREAGVRVVVWSEHLAGCEEAAPTLAAQGIPWFGYHRPRRWPADRAVESALASVQDLLALDIWDAVVASSADLADRFGDQVRNALPNTPFLVDNMVLAYLQSDRAQEIGLKLPEQIVVDKEWELGVYQRANAVITSSEDERQILSRELPDLETHSFDVGAYEPRARPSAEPRDRIVFLGSFLHPPNIDAVLWWLEDIGPLLAEKLQKVVPLRVVGTASETVLAEHSDSPLLDVRGWVEELSDEMATANVCLVPLRYGAGTKDKISVAMRYGTPVVTTSIGAESMPADLLHALSIADTPAAITTQLAALLEKPKLWRQRVAVTQRAARDAWHRQHGAEERFARWFRAQLGNCP